jgi:hypothetical protein
VRRSPPAGPESSAPPETHGGGLAADAACKRIRDVDPGRMLGGRMLGYRQ